jgi:hypothetical protein
MVSVFAREKAAKAALKKKGDPDFLVWVFFVTPSREWEELLRHALPFYVYSSLTLCSIASGIFATDIKVRATWFNS